MGSVCGSIYYHAAQRLRIVCLAMYVHHCTVLVLVEWRHAGGDRGSRSLLKYKRAFVGRLVGTKTAFNSISLITRTLPVLPLSHSSPAFSPHPPRNGRNTSDPSSTTRQEAMPSCTRLSVPGFLDSQLIACSRQGLVTCLLPAIQDRYRLTNQTHPFICVQSLTCLHSGLMS